jgi:large subunit ribosomal protein L4
MELVVLNHQGSKTGRKVTLSDSIFGIEPNEHAMYLDVKQYLANQRQGTHKAKQRAEIHRTTKKLKKQKGTGGARAGSMKSPLFIGGGRVFGPQPRDYGFKLNKKLKSLARLSALSSKAKTENISVLETITMDAPKTKTVQGIFKALDLKGRKTLIVVGEGEKNMLLSARNLVNVDVKSATSLSTYDILRADNLVLIESAISKFDELYTQE